MNRIILPVVIGTLWLASACTRETSSNPSDSIEKNMDIPSVEISQVPEDSRTANFYKIDISAPQGSRLTISKGGSSLFQTESEETTFILVADIRENELRDPVADFEPVIIIATYAYFGAGETFIPLNIERDDFDSVQVDDYTQDFRLGVYDLPFRESFDIGSISGVDISVLIEAE